MNDVNHLKLLKSEKVPATQASQVVALTTVLIKPSGHIVHVSDLPEFFTKNPILQNKDGCAVGVTDG